MIYRHSLPIAGSRQEVADLILQYTQAGWQLYNIWGLREGGSQLDFYREVLE